MSPLPSGKGGTSNTEMETLWTQLDRLKEKIGKVEDDIYELARQYSRLPLVSRQDSRISTEAQRILEDVFWEADKKAQHQFWGEEVGQARFVCEALEGTAGWYEKMRDQYFVKREHVPPSGFYPLDVNIAREAIQIAQRSLANTDMRVKNLRYQLCVFGERERAEFWKQGDRDMDVCYDGVRRFLFFWPSTRRTIKGGKGMAVLVEGFLKKEVEAALEEDHTDGDSGIWMGEVGM